MPFTRRQFLVSTSSLPLLGFTPTLREGLYTSDSAFTESSGIDFHIALADTNSTQLQIKKIDLHEEPVVWSQMVAVSSAQESFSPGLDAGFDVATTIPAATLGTGYYEATILEADMRPENVENNFTNDTSRNDVARFTITPDVPGSEASVLWVEDHLTEACYCGFGERSIYGPQEGLVRTVGWRRPGVNIGSFRNHKPINFLTGHGTPLEYTNLARLSTATLADLPYSLVILGGQFEYMPTSVLELLYEYAVAGGHVLIASSEFAVFRARLDLEKGWVTTFKYDWSASDSHAADPDMAGIGMTSPFPETNLCGQSVWLAHNTGIVWKDITLHNESTAGWIWEGTGLSAGDLVEGAFRNFAQGSLIDTSGPEPIATASNAIIWGTSPADSALQWWTHDNTSFHQNWPLFSNYATGTLNYVGSGWIVGYPNHHMVKKRLLGSTALRTMLSNIVAAATA